MESVEYFPTKDLGSSDWVMKQISIVILLMMVVLFIGYKKMNFALEDKKEEMTSFKDEITLLVAYQMGMNKAKEFSKKNELIYLNSVNDGRISGQDGKEAIGKG